jgi:GNAT superfamily N-acetyltransferase
VTSASGDPYRDLARRLEARHEGLRLIVALRWPENYEDHPGLVTVNTIVLPPERQGRGIGTEVLGELCALADESGHWMAVTPVSDLGASSVARLVRFYERFGFTANRGPCRPAPR